MSSRGGGGGDRGPSGMRGLAVRGAGQRRPLPAAPAAPPPCRDGLAPAVRPARGDPGAAPPPTSRRRGGGPVRVREPRAVRLPRDAAAGPGFCGRRHRARAAAADGGLAVPIPNAFPAAATATATAASVRTATGDAGTARMQAITRGILVFGSG